MKLQDANGAYTSTDTTVTTTTETVAVASPILHVNRNSAIVLVTAWCELLIGAGTTSLRVLIRRGATTSGAAVTEANNNALKTAAGSAEPLMMTIFEQLTSEQAVQYCFTVLQNGATGDGTVRQAGIMVLIV